MNAMLSTGTAHRVVMAADLNIPDPPETVEPLMAAGFAGDREPSVATGSAVMAAGQGAPHTAGTPFLAVPATTVGASWNGIVSGPISVGLPTGPGAVVSLIGGNVGQRPKTATPSASPLRFGARGGQNPNVGRLPGGILTRIHPVETVPQTGDSSSVTHRGTRAEPFGRSPTAIDAALAATGLFERPEAAMPPLDAEPTAPRAFDAPSTGEEQSGPASESQRSEAVIAAVAAFLVTDRALRGGRGGPDRTQRRRPSPPLHRDQS
jgi:hypothetical protein